ncbi:MAG TPA: 2-dehydropantoate 2-reductase [Thermoanaerobaculia bacterium]|nr:2-dehydropantoate 2-reductase [Thermoanaerobaculia bacterium]
MTDSRSLDSIRIAVVGAGGVGGYFGGKLASAGIDTLFIARGATLAALRKDGLRVDSIEGDFTVAPVNATDDPAGAGPVDAVLFATKAWQIPEAADRVRPLMGRDTVAVPLENGMEAPEQLARILGREHVFGGLCGIVSYIVAPGHIRHAAISPFVMFGEIDNRRTQRAERLLRAFERAGVRAEIPEDIHRSMWSKFLFITPMSAIGALTRVPIGTWRAAAQTRALAVGMLREMVSVAAARGVALDEEAVDRTMGRYEGMEAGSTSSLQRDIMEGRPSELDAQLGAVVRMGREAGVPTPLAGTLYALLVPQERNARNPVL